MGIPIPGGFSGATVSGTSTPVEIPASAQACWILSAGDVVVAIYGPEDADDPSAAVTSFDDTKGALLGAGLYGPFDFIAGYHTYVHVGGNGGTSAVTVTFIT